MSLIATDLDIAVVKLITPRRFGDDRGFFSESYNKRVFQEAGIDADFIQDNHSFSAEPHTLRGMHYQAPPHAQTKLVRAVTGSILDIVVDVRKGSPTFGKSVQAVLSAESGAQIFVPKGFLHGFLTLEPETHVLYKVDEYYSGEADGSVAWDDPDLGLDWGVKDLKPVLSDKDATAPRFSEWDNPF